MTKRDVLAIALRILGVIGLVRSTTLLPSTLLMAGQFSQAQYRVPSDFNSTVYIVGSILFLLLFFLFALAFTFRADRIAALLMPNDAQIPPFTVTGSAKTVFTLAVQIAGLYLLITSVPKLGFLAARMHESLREAQSVLRFARIEQSLESFIGIALGLYLLFAAKQVAGWVYGQERAQESVEQR